MINAPILREFITLCLTEEAVRKSFTMQLSDDVYELADAFWAEGHDLYVVGGAVRDAVLGKAPKDIDLATGAVPDEVIRIVKALPGHKVIEVGKSFGVVRVVTPSGGDYEIATFRRDIGKGRRPDAVEFTGIDDDVKRRDLTINALFYDVNKEEIVDLVGGLHDLENNIVRAVGDPKERFDEDRLRILRALRFAARMGSGLDPETGAAIKNDNSLKGVSPERIRDEFLKGILSARKPELFIDLVDEYELWPQVFPGLDVSGWKVTSRNVPVVLAILLIMNDPKLVNKRLNALKYSAIEVSQVTFLLELTRLNVSNAFKLKKLYKTSKLSDNDVREFVTLSGLPRDQRLIEAFLQYEPSVKGDELMAQGFTGADLGRELERRETLRFQELLEGS